MIKPKEITITDMDGVAKTYTITRFTTTDGIDILLKLPMSAMPVIGDFEKLKGVRDDIFKFVFVDVNGNKIALSTKALIDNHVNDAGVAIKIIKEILVYNYSFFQNGTLSILFAKWAENIPVLAQKILIPLFMQSSQKNKRH